MNNTKNQRLLMALALSLTLGMAPFVPEPHLFGKVRWLVGGAEGMQPMDYFDLVLHGAPWIFLVIVAVQRFIPTKK